MAASKTAAALDDQLIDIAATLKHADSDSTFSYELKDDEPIGFFFPVHGWRPPLIVKEFVRRLRINQSGSYCYVVCTAGDNVGEAVDILEKDLAEVGIKVHSAISLIMPESYVGLPFMDVDKPEKEAKKKREADEKLSKFIDDIRQRRHGIRDILIGNWPRINSRLIGDVFIRWIIKDTPFRVDPNRCISCVCASTTAPSTTWQWTRTNTQYGYTTASAYRASLAITTAPPELSSTAEEQKEKDNTTLKK